MPLSFSPMGFRRLPSSGMARGCSRAFLTKLDAGEWNLAPVVIAEQGRVAIGDEIAERLGASLAVVLIGERPGLSSPDSLGIYLTWNPHPGVTDADRNCISNIWAGGLSYHAAAHRLFFLMTEARSRKLSGIALRENASSLQTESGRITLLER